MKFTNRQIEIIKAATTLIGDKGVQNLTTKKLAAEMNFSEPALYRHFKDKTEILKSVLVFYKDYLAKGLKSIIESNDLGIEKIREMIEFQFDHFSKFPAVVMVIFSETSFQYDHSLSKLVSEIIIQKRLTVSNIIRKGQEEGVIRKDIIAEQLTTIVMGGMRLTILEWRLANFDYSLINKGETLWKTIEKILKKE